MGRWRARSRRWGPGGVVGDDDYATPGTPPCDWDDPAAQELLVDEVKDAKAALAAMDGEQFEGPALEAATGKVITDLRARHTSADFVAFLNKVNCEVPDDLAVHGILDNLATHKTPTVQKWLLRHKRFHFHFTPTYGSWMNLVERWFSALTTKKLQRSAHRNIKELAADIRAWAEEEHRPQALRVARDRQPDPLTPRRLLRRPQRERHQMTRNIVRRFNLPEH